MKGAKWANTKENVGKHQRNQVEGKMMTISEISEVRLEASDTQNQPAAAARLTGHNRACARPPESLYEEADLLERCFGRHAEWLKSQRILEVIRAGGDGVFIQYEYELKDGTRHRTTEFIAVRDGQLAETQITMGGLL